MRWWSDLWLNESFATIMGKVAMARHPVLKERYPNIWLHFLYEKFRGSDLDEKPTTHPVLADCPDTDVGETLVDGKISLWASKTDKIILKCRHHLCERSLNFKAADLPCRLQELLKCCG